MIAWGGWNCLVSVVYPDMPTLWLLLRAGLHNQTQTLNGAEGS